MAIATMSTDIQQPAPAVPARRQFTAASVGSLVTRWLWRIGMLAMATLWVIIWGSIALTTGRMEGPVDGLVVAAYAVLPVIAYVLWRGYRLARPPVAA